MIRLLKQSCSVEFNSISFQVFIFSWKTNSSWGLWKQTVILYLLQISTFMLEITVEGSACRVALGKAAKCSKGKLKQIAAGSSSWAGANPARAQLCTMSAPTAGSVCGAGADAEWCERWRTCESQSYWLLFIEGLRLNSCFQIWPGIHIVTN